MPRPRPLALLAAGALAALAAGGCANATTGDDPVKLTVTRGFGARDVLERTTDEVPGSETAMRLVQRNADVSTRYGGGFVQCVNDLCGGEASGRREDWFYFVNGIEAPKGAAATRVRPGDHVWWDRRVWDAAERVPAVVGSFPEPFLHGPGREAPAGAGRVPAPAGRRSAATRGRRSSTSASPRRRRRCAARSRRTRCAWSSARGTSCARTARCRGSRTARRASGVYAEPRADGRSIALLDPRGRIVRTLRAGGGLVAATRVGEEQPVWALTGTDAAGVAAAVAGVRRAHAAQSLRGRRGRRRGRRAAGPGGRTLMYRRRASPLHAARAGVTGFYGLALVALALVSTHPLLLGAVAVAVVGAGDPGRGGRRPRPRRPLRGAAGGAAGARQRARRARGPDGRAPARRDPALRLRRHHPRGARRRAADRRAGGRRRARVRAARGDRRSRRRPARPAAASRSARR